MNFLFRSAVLFLFVPSIALADYEEGRRAANRGDFTTARKEWAPLAEQGEMEAEFSLGRMYARGDGVQKSFETAAELFRRAANQGHGKAAYNLGMMYEFGDGVPQDLSVAKRWYKRAAAAGERSAKAKLATMTRVLDLPEETPAPESIQKDAGVVEPSTVEPVPTITPQETSPMPTQSVNEVVVDEPILTPEPTIPTIEVIEIPDTEPTVEEITEEAPQPSLEAEEPQALAAPPPLSALGAISRFLKGS